MTPRIIHTDPACRRVVDAATPTCVRYVRGDAYDELVERACAVILAHKPDASFDDSADGAAERAALLSNVAAEVRSALSGEAAE